MLASTAAAGAATEKNRTRYYALHQFHLKFGTQPARIHEYFSKTFLPKLNKVHTGPKIFLDALVAPHMPQVAAIVGYKSIEEYTEVLAALTKDEEFARGYTAWETGAEQPTEHYASTLLEATEYSPDLTAPATPPKTSRIFELRVYHSPSFRQLQLLHERFAGPEIKIFHRVGVHPVLYASTVFGANKPNLTYLIPFDDLASREKAWNAFGADPEWAKVRQESVERGGQIASVIQIAIYRATAYSPIR